MTRSPASTWREPGGPWDVPPLDAALPPNDVVDGAVRLSPAELDGRVGALAAGLRARGVRRRDVVAWQLPNWHEAVLLYRACWRVGAVAAPLHHAAREADLAAALAELEPRLVLAGDGFPACDVDGALHVRGDDDEFAALLAEGGDARAVTPRPSEPAVVLFTSGSSGAPKGVVHTHRGLAYKARLMAAVHGLARDDVVLMPAPCAHISGLLNGILVPAAAGMRTVLMDRWDPDRALDLVESERVSFMVGPPTFFVSLMDATTFSPPRVTTLRLVSSGGAGVTPAFVDTASAALGCTVKRTYGSTEAPTITTSYAGDPPDRARSTDGRAVGAAEVRLAPTGEVLVRGPELFAGYLGAAHAPGAWFHTGDLGRLDGGWLTIVGRVKDVIIRGGENISTAEVETVLEAHPAVRQAVAVGEPDRRLGERVVAFVVADAAFDLDECRAWFEARGVTKYKWPERVVPLDALPLLASGKPDRGGLRARAAGED